MTAKTKTSSAAGEAERDTKLRILDVAERMIGMRGVRLISIREITRESGVNLAAINYHFGSKRRLVVEVFVRRITVLNEERMAMLDEAEAAAEGGAPTVEAILEASIKPLLHTDERERNRYTHTAKMISRFFLDPDLEVVALLKPHFLPIKERLLKMLGRALPGLGKDELEWRTSHVFGLLNHSMLFADLRCHAMGKNLNVKKEMRRLVTFCAAGLRAAPDAGSSHHQSRA